MGKTSYITSNGMMIGEMTSGVMRAYGPDALGSVVATYTGSALENTYQYKPYGGTLAKTGTATDPSFLWNGGSGYRATTLTNSGFYVRKRHYSSVTALWTTQDQLWPRELQYGYVNCGPVGKADYSGLASKTLPCSSVPSNNNAINKVRTAICYLQTQNTPQLDFCTSTCNLTCKLSVDPACIETLCSTLNITCQTCDTASTYACKSPCSSSTIKVPPCGLTNNCAPGGIVLCYNAASTLISAMCSCPLGYIIPLNCVDILTTIGHEIAHACSPNCAPDEGAGSGNNDCWGTCFTDCILKHTPP